MRTLSGKFCASNSANWKFFGLCFAMLNIVLQEMTIPTFIFLCLLNMWLTRFSKP